MSKSSKKSSKKHDNGHGKGSVVVLPSSKSGRVADKKSANRKKKSKQNLGPEEPAFRHVNGLRIEGKPRKKLSKKVYNRELKRLQLELVKLQEWVLQTGLKVVIIFEGRDAAGKGGTIKRVMDCLNPRYCKVVALGKPTEREKSQWYFQRYVQHLPAAGEIVLLDRSWYNRAGVERVMGFCTDEEYFEFLRSCPEFECMIKRSGIILLKYWFSVSSEEQENRFLERSMNPSKRWKLSPMDLEARTRWVDYSKAKDAMFEATDIKRSPWYVVNSDVKKKARLNCIAHILSMIPYRDMVPEPLTLPPRQPEGDYLRPPTSLQTFVPEIY
ncbi:MAG: polyphosphate kinase 2 [Synechococcus sp.]